MKLRTIYVLATVFCLFYVLTGAKLKTSGGHPSSTGAPGDQTCAQAGCHLDAIVQPGTTVNTLIFGNNETMYNPGQTYDITVKNESHGILKFGFELVALRNSDNLNVGTITITQPVTTQLIIGQVPIADRKYITHNTNGTVPFAPGIGQWSFRWQAPATDIGPITFWYATNATNNNNQNTGDSIYLSSFTINGPTGIDDVEVEKFNLSFHPDSREILINFASQPPSDAELFITDMSGRGIFRMTREEFKSKAANNKIAVSGDFAPGLYIVSVGNKNGISSGKIVLW